MLRRWSKVIVQHRFDCGLTRRPRQAVVERTRAQPKRMKAGSIARGSPPAPPARRGRAVVRQRLR